MADVKLIDNEVIAGNISEASTEITLVLQNEDGLYNIPIHSVKYIRQDNP